MDAGSLLRTLRCRLETLLPPRRLRHVEIETTSYCNRKCVYCPNATVGRPEEQMKEEVFIRIIDSLARMRFKGRISPHFYGEPLADERLVRLLAYAHSKLPEAELIIYTNGDYLSVNKYRELKTAGVKKFRVSLHSKSPTKELRETLDHIALNPPPELDMEIVNYYLEYQEKSTTHLNNRGGLVPIERRKNPLCRYVNQLTIDYRGFAVLCCNDYNASVVFGNVMEREIGDIWRAPQYVKARAQISNGIYPYPVCRSYNI